MPMCGLRRKGYGSPRWSSSGSTEPPPSSSGLHWRTSLQLVVVLDSSLSATLSLRMTGETICTVVTFFCNVSAEIEYNSRHKITNGYFCLIFLNVGIGSHFCTETCVLTFLSVVLLLF